MINQALFVPPQYKALLEAIAYTWEHEHKCKKNKCKLVDRNHKPLCGTACQYVCNRLSNMGLLQSVMAWQQLNQSKAGELKEPDWIDHKRILDQLIEVSTELQCSDAPDKQLLVELAITREKESQIILVAKKRMENH